MHTSLALARWGAGGAILMTKQKNMIQSLGIMFDIFITADCFGALDV